MGDNAALGLFILALVVLLALLRHPPELPPKQDMKPKTKIRKPVSSRKRRLQHRLNNDEDDTLPPRRN